MTVFSDAAPRLLQENQRYLSQLTSLMQEAADEQSKSIVVSSSLTRYYSYEHLTVHLETMKNGFNFKTFNLAIYLHLQYNKICIFKTQSL